MLGVRPLPAAASCGAAALGGSRFDQESANADNATEKDKRAGLVQIREITDRVQYPKRDEGDCPGGGGFGRHAGELNDHDRRREDGDCFPCILLRGVGSCADSFELGGLDARIRVVGITKRPRTENPAEEGEGDRDKDDDHETPEWSSHFVLATW